MSGEKCVLVPVQVPTIKSLWGTLATFSSVTR